MIQETAQAPPAVPDRTEEVGELYDELEHDVLHFGYWDDESDPSSFTEASARLTELVLQRLRPADGSSVLDVGCGNGTPALRVGETTGARLTGITVSEEQIGRASRRAEKAGLAGRLRFQRADATALPFPADSFDHAFALESVQHMDRLAALREMARVVRPGGRIVLTDLFRRAPAPPQGPPVMDALVPMWRMSPPITLDEYPGLLEQAGLELLELNDVTAQVIRRSFTEVLGQIQHALDSGQAASIPSAGRLDLTVEANQRAVLDFARHMTGTREVGYLLLTAAVPGAGQ
ncbi:methyltransferase domain-containing protein [Kineosporia rhizophila]|uniref:SAM-dependent methyltransferase n=1 Tax=Kineosporia rhizophila TaxID=84633 RepID=UPI001E4C0CA1|nr:methyltransferase domain-containing protein [Kineosporia rhizophila]MCE0536199.1 methyltransferase domain-containing protein [Kineosporia rhizophila]